VSYGGDVGEECACCHQIIKLDYDGTYECACTAGECDNCCNDHSEEEQ